MGYFSRARRSERGAVLVEFALILPIFFALVLGMITFGDAYFKRLSIEDSVRDGTRFASTLEAFDGDSNTGANTADEQVVAERVASLSGGELNASDVCVAKVSGGSADSTCGVDNPDGTAADDDIVKVSASVDSKIEVIFFARTITLSASSAALCERCP